MLFTILVSFIVIGVATIFHFKSQNEKYHFERLQRKERAVLAGLDYSLSDIDINTNVDSLRMLLAPKIKELSDINQMEINIFDSAGNHLVSSYKFDIDTLIPLKVLGQLMEGEEAGKSEHLILKELHNGISTYSSYSYIYNSKGTPKAIIHLPYYDTEEELEDELERFLTTLAEIYIFLFLGGSILSFFLSSYITSSLKTVSEKLRSLQLGKNSEPLTWRWKDEIGDLVNEYNRKVQELEESTKLLAQSERESAWKQMAQQVAHEIKNPLTPMKLSVQHLERLWKNEDPNFGERLTRFSGTLIDQIDALSAIASGFADFAKMNTAVKDRVDLVALIQSNLDLLEGYENLSISFESVAKHYELLADKTQLLRVINNLLKNAQQAIVAANRAQGKIDITLHKTPDNVLELSIQDNGIGMEADVRDKVFQPSFTTKTSGSGLGLVMVKSIVEAHNASISFITEPNIGSTFIVRFKLS